MTLSRAPLLLVLSAAVLAVGCGGGSSDSSKVEKTVQTAFADLANGNGQGFCSLTTPAGQKSLAQNLPGASCAKVLNLVSAHLSTQQKNGLRHASVKSVTVKGGKTATVKNSDITTSSGSLSGVLGSSSATTTLTKQSDGSWKLSG